LTNRLTRPEERHTLKQKPVRAMYTRTGFFVVWFNSRNYEHS
jgi:hypothetical protein